MVKLLAALAALTFVSAPAQASKYSADVLEPLMTSLMVWASPNIGLPVPDAMPRVKFAERCEIERYYYEDASRECSNGTFGVQAIYDHRVATVFLQDTWSADSLYDVSVLLHEVIHHMQASAGKSRDTVSCPGQELELPAYHAQMDWLTAAGVDAAETMNVNALGLMLITMCEGRR